MGLYMYIFGLKGVLFFTTYEITCWLLAVVKSDLAEREQALH